MLSHVEEPITLACSATPTVDPLPEAAKKDSSALGSTIAGGETKQQVLEKSRRSSKWQSSKANFALPKTQPGRHLANVQKEGGERILPRNYEFDLANKLEIILDTHNSKQMQSNLKEYIKYNLSDKITTEKYLNFFKKI